MTSNQTSSIRFSVEESVWFKKGQEVSELLSMSLDPEISIQEHENYISIRGALVLTGDYFPREIDQDDNDENEQDLYSLRDIAPVRAIDEVRKTEDGALRMKHRFPVDITIPANRIRSLDDVYILIESFDYEIPEAGRLELKADLAISGIVNERSKVETGGSREQVSDFRAIEATKPLGKTNEPNQTASDAQNSNEPVIPTIPFFSSKAVKEQKVLNPFRDFLNSPGKENVEANAAIEKFPSFTTEVRKEAINNVESKQVEQEVRNELKQDNEKITVQDKDSAISRLEATKEVQQELLARNRDGAQDNDQPQQQIPASIRAQGAPAQTPTNVSGKNEQEQPALEVRGQNIHEETSKAQIQEQSTANVLEHETSLQNEQLEQQALRSEQNASAAAVSEVNQNAPQIGVKTRIEPQGYAWNPKSLYSQEEPAPITALNSQESANSSIEQAKKAANRSENALYLTKMLSSEGEHDFSKLRMRIVQQGDTLGKIASLYDISVSQIMRVNGLADDVIEEGQILYIPENVQISLGV